MIYQAADILRNSNSYLENTNEVEWVLSHILNCDRAELYCEERILSEDQYDNFRNLLSDRKKGIPLQYLLGNISFMGFEFIVRPGVFIPRPETELLVEEAIDLLKLNFAGDGDFCPKILDLCSGCGNIGISLTKLRSNSIIISSDISKTAISTTQANAKRHGCDKRLKAIQSDLFKGLEGEGLFDIILSNPPYVRSEDVASSLPVELGHEPKAAFDGGDDGLFFYRCIIEESPAFLKKGGFLVMEVGFDQAEDIEDLLRAESSFEIVKVRQDYAGIERIIVANLR
ncbi:MAG: peptide chain release factor N(5)-glutamine methyltransferase [Candidatus Omnitrophica bacterium]|nr:peptide chain release factor N(5)-glutamine methyltransferase [Candidatus Omnitrophota bacterium]